MWYERHFLCSLSVIFSENKESKLYYILTLTKNASLIITDFLAIIYKNDQPRTASLCRGWAIWENDFNLICR